MISFRVLGIGNKYEINLFLKTSMNHVDKTKFYLIHIFFFIFAPENSHKLYLLHRKIQTNRRNFVKILKILRTNYLKYKLYLFIYF